MDAKFASKFFFCIILFLAAVTLLAVALLAVMLLAIICSSDIDAPPTLSLPLGGTHVPGG